MNRNIWTEEPYIYKATSSGINIYDLGTEALVSMAYWDGGINSVWADTDYVFMATTNSGILWFSVSTISGSPDVTDQLAVYKNYPDITNEHVNYLHGAGSYLCATTISGVDNINLTTSSGIYTTVSGAQKCYQTESGRFYYDIGNSLNVVYDNTQDWINPGYVYSTGDGIIPIGIEINDVFVTEGTSAYQSSDNVIFLATTSGAVVIEERKGDEENSRVKYFFVEP